MIRLAGPDDIPNVAALAMQVWLDTYATEGIRRELADYVFAHLTPAALAVELAGRTVFVAEEASHLLGFAQVGLDVPCAEAPAFGAELERLYVARHFAGRGLGRALLDAAQGVAPSGLWLTVWERNDPAIGFYRRCGYAQVGERWIELGDERHRNVVMARDTVLSGAGR